MTISGSAALQELSIEYLTYLRLSIRQAGIIRFPGIEASTESLRRISNSPPALSHVELG